ncbi:MAG: AAA family ATPase, partial [Muribaculaceae bacterium]|nr:AAA family ATPase [Muribaculaceae bacterium]
MRLSKIDILNFKNIPEARLEFSPGVNCLLGMNGMGKSNLLEAVYF